MKDIDLVYALKNSDQQAFNIVFNKYYEPLLAYITTFTKDRQSAKDIVQNSFIIFWDNRKKMHDDSTIKSFLFRIAHNKFINDYKKNEYRLKVLSDLKYDALSSRIEDSESTKEERTRKLNSLIETLPPKCREVLLLHKRDGKKYTEIAETLNISVKTVESQMRIAYQKIREGFKTNGVVMFLSFQNFKNTLRGCFS
ncbi:RNA polymerase sigma-70 factor [Arenibacter sp. 6A1]|uniref:RNA polymerase sigma factor n=1 Tax=Arenibacter sp. 6A1 TaxID=2720391 RepID=UPI00144855F3|nr:RNA polymerase sigma-70 factor [Arenibacter sp. 6A1]NKI26921.1 RNA polymerase sigma-70 factor [Arenibacter sp. 6A1]